MKSKHYPEKLRVSLNKHTTLGEQHTLKTDDSVHVPVAIVFHTTGTAGPEPGRDNARRLAACWNSCDGLILGPDTNIRAVLLGTLPTIEDAWQEALAVSHAGSSNADSFLELAAKFKAQADEIRELIGLPREK